jgi:hypothetical protein
MLKEGVTASKEGVIIGMVWNKRSKIQHFKSKLSLHVNNLNYSRSNLDRAQCSISFFFTATMPKTATDKIQQSQIAKVMIEKERETQILLT